MIVLHKLCIVPHQAQWHMTRIGYPKIISQICSRQERQEGCACLMRSQYLCTGVAKASESPAVFVAMMLALSVVCV